MSKSLTDALALRSRRVYAEVRAIVEAARELPEADRERALDALGYVADVVSDAGARFAKPSSVMAEVQQMLWHLNDASLEQLRAWIGGRIMHDEYMLEELPPPMPPARDPRRDLVGGGS